MIVQNEMVLCRPSASMFILHLESVQNKGQTTSTIKGGIEKYMHNDTSDDVHWSPSE